MDKKAEKLIVVTTIIQKTRVLCVWAIYYCRDVVSRNIIFDKSPFLYLTMVNKINGSQC